MKTHLGVHHNSVSSSSEAIFVKLSIYKCFKNASVLIVSKSHYADLQNSSPLFQKLLRK